MLDELDSHVDRTSTRLDKAQKKMTRFIRQNQGSPSSLALLALPLIYVHLKDSPASWCILILIIVLSVLLFVILFF